MLGLEKLIDIILNLLIAIGLLAVYESRQKNAKPNPIIIELFLISVPVLYFAFIENKEAAYFFTSIFTLFFIWLFINRYIEAINYKKKKEEIFSIMVIPREC